MQAGCCEPHARSGSTALVPRGLHMPETRDTLELPESAPAHRLGLNPTTQELIQRLAAGADAHCTHQGTTAGGTSNHMGAIYAASHMGSARCT